VPNVKKINHGLPLCQNNVDGVEPLIHSVLTEILENMGYYDRDDQNDGEFTLSLDNLINK
jgi:hypothetical protein